MTRGELIFAVSRSLGLDDTASSDELTLMQRWANQAVVEVLLRTHIYIDIGNTTLTADESEYRLDSAILAIDDGYGTTAAGIGPYDLVTTAEMIAIQSAAPVGPTRKVVAIEGDLLIVAPVPETSETLTFYYVPRPTAMSDDSHDPSNATYGGIPSEHHRALEYYMLWRGAEYDDKQMTRAQEYLQQFERECVAVRKARRHKASRRLKGAPMAGYPGSNGPRYGRNDIYPDPYGR